MKNIKRNPKYIKLLHSIKSCTNVAQLICLSETVRNHCEKNKQDADLMIEYLNKRDTFEIHYEDETLTQLHKLLTN